MLQAHSSASTGTCLWQYLQTFQLPIILTCHFDRNHLGLVVAKVWLSSSKRYLCFLLCIDMGQYGTWGSSCLPRNSALCTITKSTQQTSLTPHAWTKCTVRAQLIHVTVLQLGFTDDIDPALSLKLISQSMLAFLNRHLPLTEAQRRLFKQPQTSSQSTAPGDFTDLAAASHEMSDASNQNRKQSSAGDHMVGQINGMQAGNVVNDGAANGMSDSKSLSGRTCEFRVQAEERAVYEEVCKDHIAVLELSL